jgi:aspartate/methionine/tyrosine aminotransferase
VNGERLSANAAIVMDTLRALNLPFLTPSFGMFIWADLRKLLRRFMQRGLSAVDAEWALYCALLDEDSVVFTPGVAQHASEPGFFRICYAYAQPVVLREAMKRLSLRAKGAE